MKLFWSMLLTPMVVLKTENSPKLNVTVDIMSEWISESKNYSIYFVRRIWQWLSDVRMHAVVWIFITHFIHSQRSNQPRSQPLSKIAHFTFRVSSMLIFAISFYLKFEFHSSAIFFGWWHIWIFRLIYKYPTTLFSVTSFQLRKCWLLMSSSNH